MSSTVYVDEDDTDEFEPPGDRRLRRVLIVLAVLVVLAAVLTWVVAFSSLFGVRSVTVRGAHVLSPRTIERIADVTHGTPLVRLDTDAITRRVERLTDVESAQVDTSFPSTVIITVRERTAVGYTRVAGKDMLVDHTGYQYRGVDRPPPHLPRFVVPHGNAARSAGAAVATAAAALPAKLLHRITSIQALDPGSITLVLRDQRVVRWGSAARSADKARVLPILLTRSGTHIDVTDPDQPFSR